jgi:hypothetical protein
VRQEDLVGGRRDAATSDRHQGQSARGRSCQRA